MSDHVTPREGIQSIVHNLVFIVETILLDVLGPVRVSEIPNHLDEAGHASPCRSLHRLAQGQQLLGARGGLSAWMQASCLLAIGGDIVLDGYRRLLRHAARPPVAHQGAVFAEQIERVLIVHQGAPARPFLPPLLLVRPTQCFVCHILQRGHEIELLPVGLGYRARVDEAAHSLLTDELDHMDLRPEEDVRLSRAWRRSHTFSTT